MDHESMPVNVRRQIPLSRVRPGMVLTAPLKELPDHNAGHVLTVSDIEQLKLSGSDIMVPVAVIESAPLSAVHDSGPSAAEKCAKQVRHFESIMAQTRENPAVNERLSAEIETLVRLKKEAVRGDDYQAQLDNIISREKSKYDEHLKNSSTQARLTSMQAIEKYAASTADIRSLSLLEALSPAQLIKKLDMYEKNIMIFIDALLCNQQVQKPFIENIVLDVVKDFGQDYPTALLSQSAQASVNRDFYATHVLQVMLVSVVTAMELTKMVQEKAASLDRSDLGTLMSMEKKFFTLEDFINIGIAAILHDIGFKKSINGLCRDYRMTLAEQSLLETHPSEGYHILQKLPLDYDIQRAVYQHQERMNGSGGPQGILPRLFSRYTAVLMFAEYYVESTTVTPFTNRYMTQRDCIVELLTRRKDEFDTDCVYAFVRAASLFPVGSWLMLGTGEVGVVVRKSEAHDKPVVQVLLDRHLNRVNPYEINLAEKTVPIVRPLDPHALARYFRDPVLEPYSVPAMMPSNA